MKLKFPQGLAKFQHPKLTWFELNDFDADLVFPSLYGLIVTGGERHGANRLVRRIPVEGGKAKVLPITPDDLLQGLSEHPKLQGFGTPDGRALLRDWVHTAVARLATKTQSRQGEVVRYVLPVHLATYSAGLPSTPALRRQADLALFAALDAHLRSLNVDAPLATLRTLFKEILGKGVDYGSGQDSFRPHHDGTTLDIITLLTLYYLEQFDTPPLQAGKPKERTDALRDTPFLLPSSMDLLASELLGYLVAHRNRLPASTVSQGLVAQASLGLLRYFLQTVTTVGRLMSGSRGDAAAAAPAELDLYVDVTGVRNSPSDRLARRAVARDLANIGRFFGQVQTLRVLDSIVHEVVPAADGPLLDEIGQQLDDHRGNSDVRSDARHLIRQIRELNTTGDTPVTSESDFEQLMDGVEDPLDRLTLLLSHRGTNSGVANFVKWYWSSGGIAKPYGILDGNLRDPKKNWRYYLPDELLSVLVQQAFITRPMTDLTRTDGHLRSKLSLSDFLTFLRENYGILIDRPPKDSDDPETRRAAADNLEALKLRLRQMGYFHLLSDDFAAQYLRNPLLKDLT